MKTIKQLAILWVFITLSTNVFSQNWQLVWSDEFTSSIGSDWVFETGNGTSGWGNNELQYYRKENASVQNGQLVITAKKESYGGFSYTSARMKTQGKKSWKYGKIEARIAMPAFQGVWPAFWMLGDNISTVSWPSCGEIDIMEHVNAENKVYGTVHWSDNNGNYASYGGNTSVAVTGYHVYSIEWTATTIKWFVDGVQYHIIDITNGINGTSEFQNNFFIILNMAIGGNWPGFTINTSAFPAYMYVDYVRVYQDAGTPSFTKLIEAEGYSSMSGVQIEGTTDTGGGSNVGYIETGDWMAYSNINFPYTGTYKVEYRTASLSGGGRLSLDLNSGSTVLGYLNIPSTGGWQNWTTISHNVVVNAGTYSLGIYAQAGGWNINWLRITYVSSAKSQAENVTSLSGIKPNDTNDLELFPNPVVNELRIKSNSDLSNGIVKIYDMAGRQILTTINASGKLDVSSLKTGTYVVRIVKGNLTVTKKFMK